jgi:hypothetical protein
MKLVAMLANLMIVLSIVTMAVVNSALNAIKVLGRMSKQ